MEELNNIVVTGDIDIDVPNRTAILDVLEHIQASIIDLQAGTIKPHNTGVYFQKIPQDPVSGLASLDHHRADELGYIKLDFLNMYAYDGVRNEQHLIDILQRPIDWSLLQDRSFVEQLYQLKEHFDIVKLKKPSSIEQLAIVLALIRPGKRYLLNASWADLKTKAWTKEGSGYMFKKSHAVSLATMITVQMHLIQENHTSKI